MTRSAYDANNWLADASEGAAKPAAWAVKGKGHKAKKKGLLARLFGF